MKLVVSPPAPLPSRQAPVSIRKTDSAESRINKPFIRPRIRPPAESIGGGSSLSLPWLFTPVGVALRSRCRGYSRPRPVAIHARQRGYSPPASGAIHPPAGGAIPLPPAGLFTSHQRCSSLPPAVLFPSPPVSLPPASSRQWDLRLVCTTHGLEGRGPNAERRTPNAERRTPNAERQTPLL